MRAIINKRGAAGMAEILLTAVIIARATSLLIIKVSLEGFSTFNMMALRFSLGLICMWPFVRRKIRSVSQSTLVHGVILGSLFFLVIAAELYGLRLTDSSSVVSFIENTAIVLVPLAEAVLHRRAPAAKSLVCAAIALAGVGFLLLQGGHMTINAGIVMCIITALLYTSYIIATDRVARQDDPVVLGFISIGVVAALSAAAAFTVETPRLPHSPAEWIGVLLLAVICTSIGTALQPLAQKYVPSERACVFCALSPLTTCILGWIFLGEWQGMSGLIGAALILSSIIISNLKIVPRSRRSAARANIPTPL